MLGGQSPVKKLSAMPRKWQILEIRAQKTQDVPRLLTQLLTAVRVTDRSGKQQEGLLIIKADHIRLLLTESLDYQSKD